MSFRRRDLATAACAVLACALELLAPLPARAEPARNTILWYVYPAEPDRNPFDDARARPILTYLRGGQSVDWLFDGVMLYCGCLYSATPTDAEGYEAMLFDNGRIADLDARIAEYKVELADPDYRVRTYLLLPYIPGETVIQTEGRGNQLRARWDSLAPENLQLVGFQFANAESFTSVEPACSTMATLGSWLGGLGLDFTWIPAYGAPFAGVADSCGFDAVSMQPNYMQQDCYAQTRFRAVDEALWAAGLAGAELEIEEPGNQYILDDHPGDPDGAFRDSGLGYLTAADQYNWYEHEFLPVYWNGKLGLAATSPSADRRIVYDRMYRFAVARSRRTLVPVETITAEADASVQSFHPTDNFGTATYLTVAENMAPNIVHAYVRFPLGAIPAGSHVLAAHLRLWQQGHDLGTSLDAKLLRVTGDWQESAITWNDQPATSALKTLPGLHRFQRPPLPRRHQIDVTEDVIEALANGEPSISLSLQRDEPPVSSDGEADAASFASKEGAAETAPALVVRFLPADAPPAGGAGGTGGVGGSGRGGEGAGTTGGNAAGGSSAASSSLPHPPDDSGGCACQILGPPSLRGPWGGSWMAALVGACLLRRGSRGRRRQGRTA